ncbi:MAG: BrnT family toxin [Candidatus Desantisbacteria bacterium]
MKIGDFEWDEANTVHIELGHGIYPYEAEEVFANRPLFRKIRRERYVALGPTISGRYLVIVFQKKGMGKIRVITGWDMKDKERKYYQREMEARR